MPAVPELAGPGAAGASGAGERCWPSSSSLHTDVVRCHARRCDRSVAQLESRWQLLVACKPPRHATIPIGGRNQRQGLREGPADRLLEPERGGSDRRGVGRAAETVHGISGSRSWRCGHRQRRQDPRLSGHHRRGLQRRLTDPERPADGAPAGWAENRPRPPSGQSDRVRIRASLAVLSTAEHDAAFVPAATPGHRKG